MKLPNQKCWYNLCMKILQEMAKTLQLEKLGTVGIKSAVKN